jgi:hypothetical protein
VGAVDGSIGAEQRALGDRPRLGNSNAQHQYALYGLDGEVAGWAEQPIRCALQGKHHYSDDGYVELPDEF